MASSSAGSVLLSEDTTARVSLMRAFWEADAQMLAPNIFVRLHPLGFLQARDYDAYSDIADRGAWLTSLIGPVNGMDLIELGRLFC